MNKGFSLCVFQTKEEMEEDGHAMDNCYPVL